MMPILRRYEFQGKYFPYKHSWLSRKHNFSQIDRACLLYKPISDQINIKYA